MNPGRQAILVTAADLAQPALALLENYEVVFAGLAPKEAALVALMSRHDPVGVIVRYGKITAKVIQAGKSLKVISKHGSGIDTIDVGAAENQGVAVCAATGVNAAAVAEHTMALILACAKSITGMNARMHSGNWDKATHKSMELNGHTLGLVGLGAIGRRVASMAAAMGLNVMVFDPYVTVAPQDVKQVTLDELLRNSDIVSLHCPLTDSNKNMLNENSLNALKRGAIIINTARGGLIDEEALLRAIRSGQVAAAGLDSFQQEPAPVNHPFYGEPNIVLSPHIGGVTKEAYVNMGVTSVRNLLSHLG